MFTLLRTGHANSCPLRNPNAPSVCRCEEKRYILVAVLAAITGLVEIIVGSSKRVGSMGLFIDGIHGFFDGVGYGVGAYVANRTGRDPHAAGHLRERGNKAVAMLLALSGLWFAFEAIDRFLTGYSVHPRTMAILAGIAFLVGIVNFFIIHGSPFKNNTQWGMLQHAIKDILISAVVMVSGIAGEFELVSDIRALDLGVSAVSWLYVGIILPVSLWRGGSHEHRDHREPPHT